ncbi:hypothetical protein, partial [Paeniglutamicibacter gangotriensis]|uniref:hypothetical protein n=1 Tax=Paeniglutamicibacter gangotriensis TaxID=254787 RepID=UPI001CB6F970
GYSESRSMTIRTARSRASAGYFLGMVAIFLSKDNGIKSGTVHTQCSHLRKMNPSNSWLPSQKRSTVLEEQERPDELLRRAFPALGHVGMNYHQQALVITNDQLRMD